MALPVILVQLRYPQPGINCPACIPDDDEICEKTGVMDRERAS